MDLSARVIALRKVHALSQQATVGMHDNEIKRYEYGTAQPSPEAMTKLAKALHVSTDSMFFDEAECGPDGELRLQFEAVSAMKPNDKTLAKTLLDALIVQAQVASDSTMQRHAGAARSYGDKRSERRQLIISFSRYAPLHRGRARFFRLLGFHHIAFLAHVKCGFCGKAVEVKHISFLAGFNPTRRA